MGKSNGLNIYVMLQIVDLCTIHGPNCLVISAKARREFLYAIQEAVNVEFSNSAERRSVTQLVMKLHQIWGKNILRNLTYIAKSIFMSVCGNWLLYSLLFNIRNAVFF